MNDSIVKIEKVSFIRNDRIILDKVDLDIHAGENWVILGKNGSGKTTLINILFAYTWPTEGTVTVFREQYGRTPTREIQKRIGILQGSHQEDRIQRGLTVRDILSTGLLKSIGFYGELNEGEKGKVESLIKNNPWIKDPEQNYSSLSSGEKEKVLLLRALLAEPEILILDEPCASLDISAREDFFLLLYQNKYKVKTIILITHRTDEIPDFFTHALLLKEGKVLASGVLEKVLTDDSLSNLYGMNIQLIKSEGQYFTRVIR